MECMITGCESDALNYLSIRCRTKGNRAVWSPNCNAFLCKEHAEGGVRIRIEVEAVASREVETNVFSGGRLVVTRTTPIVREAS